MILKVRKDFMVFEQRDLLWSDLPEFLCARSNVLQSKINEAALSLFCELRISSQDQ